MPTHRVHRSLHLLERWPAGKMPGQGRQLFSPEGSRVILEAWRELAVEGLPNVAGMPVPVTSWRFLLVTLRQMQSTGALDEDEEDCVLAAIVHILNNDPNEEPLISRFDGVLRRFTGWMDEDRF